MGGHEMRGTDTASSTVQSGVSKASPSESITGRAITVAEREKILAQSRRGRGELESHSCQRDSCTQNSVNF
jgi:hypothetical protein